MHVLKLQNKACQSAMLKILNNPCIIRGTASLTSHNSWFVQDKEFAKPTSLLHQLKQGSGIKFVLF